MSYGLRPVKDRCISDAVLTPKHQALSCDDDSGLLIRAYRFQALTYRALGVRHLNETAYLSMRVALTRYGDCVEVVLKLPAGLAS